MSDTLLNAMHSTLKQLVDQVTEMDSRIRNLEQVNLSLKSVILTKVVPGGQLDDEKPVPVVIVNESIRTVSAEKDEGSS